MKLAIILGTRPQIIKSVPVIMAMDKLSGVELQIVHTGQHYDYKLSNIFLNEFSLPVPIINLNIGSGSHAFQTAEIMLRLEEFLIKNNPSLVLIPGDTNSALAGALTSAKLNIPVAHIEAGARSYDMSMPEEVNRRLIDHCSSLLFTTTVNCRENLKRESVVGEIYLTGDTMFDIFLMVRDRVEECDILDQLSLAKEDYSVLTLHRAENVDDSINIRNILKGINETKENVIFPIHPRTLKSLKDNNISLQDTNIRIIDPMGYIEILKLIKHSKAVFTDSGGLQKEAFWSKIPCITIRDRTEWSETVDMGVNVLTGANTELIVQAITHVNENYYEIKNRFKDNPFGDGKASEKIVKILVLWN